MVTIFKWSEAFLTHLPSVDEQHARLFSLINELAGQVNSAKRIDSQVFSKVFKMLVDYTKFHFEDEELQMEKSRLDPRHIAYHRKEHQVFFDKILSLSGTNELSVEQAYELIEYLFHWLAYHILNVDQSMARQLRAIREGASPAQAFEDNVLIDDASISPLVNALSVLYRHSMHQSQELKKANNELEQRVRERTIELENANRQLELLSMQDVLTGLHNRRYAVSAIGADAGCR